MASVSARLSPQHRSYVSRLLCHLERQGVSWSQVAPLGQVRPRQLEHIVTTAITQHGLDSNTRTAVNRAFRLLLQGPSGIVRLMPDNPAHQALMRCLPAPLSQQYRSCISRFLYYLEQQGTHWSQLAPPNAGDAGQLEQVVMNMVVNARDAMPGGGKLVIETANATVDQTYAGPNVDLKPGSYVMLAISDTGMGMDPETTAHLFEPFFTTKAPGKGTGLGLATAYGIVKQSGGAISVYSEPGHGTTVRIYLPSAEAKAAVEVSGQTAGTALRGNETILVLEDEARVRKLICEVLTGRGYHVLEAVRGDQAVRTAADYEGRIHLLLTDVVMPEMSGPHALDQIRVTHPYIKVLFMSGYTDEAMVHHGVLGSGVPFLQKPFLPDTLARKVREVLSTQASAG